MSNELYLHQTLVRKIHWSEVTKMQYQTAYDFTSTASPTKNNQMFKCCVPERKGTRHYISTKKRYFTAIVPHGLSEREIISRSKFKELL